MCCKIHFYQKLYFINRLSSQTDFQVLKQNSKCILCPVLDIIRNNLFQRTEVSHQTSHSGSTLFETFTPTATAAKSLRLCLTLSDPMDCSPPGSSVHGIFQARVLEWGATAFSSHPLHSSNQGCRDISKRFRETTSLILALLGWRKVRVSIKQQSITTKIHMNGSPLLVLFVVPCNLNSF